MFVKICGITNEDDALLAVAMGADAVGFVFAPSPRQIAVQQAYDITRRLPPEILTVGVFRDEHPKRVSTSSTAPASRRRSSTATSRAERRRGGQARCRCVIKAYPAGSPLIAEAGIAAPPTCCSRRADARAPATLFDWALVGEVPEGMRMILAGGLDARQRRRRREDRRTVGCRRVERSRARRRARRTRSR